MTVITIRGSLGSGAAEIGKRLAALIGGDYVDREIIAQVAEQLQRRPGEIVAKEEPPGTLVGRIVEALAFSNTTAVSPGIGAMYLPAWDIPLSDTRYLEAMTTVIKRLAFRKSIVIRGRGSQFILKGYPDAFHVLTVAPVDIRVKRVTEERRLDEEAARKEIARVDGSRRAFISKYFNAELEDPVNYHLVLNTEQLSFDGAARLVVDAMPRFFYSQGAAKVGTR